jgi:Protein of unknown function (DUF4038)
MLFAARCSSRPPLGLQPRQGPPNDLTQSLRVSENARFLAQPDGSPFFWLGDTAWAIFARLTRAEAEVYLRDRASKGFTIVQAVAIGGPFDALEVANRYGALALVDKDPAQPNSKYFEHIDWVVDRAAHYGLRMAILPVWGASLVSGWSGKQPLLTPGKRRAIWPLDCCALPRQGRRLGARLSRKTFLNSSAGSVSIVSAIAMSSSTVEYRGD